MLRPQRNVLESHPRPLRLPLFLPSLSHTHTLSLSFTLSVFRSLCFSRPLGSLALSLALSCSRHALLCPPHSLARLFLLSGAPQRLHARVSPSAARALARGNGGHRRGEIERDEGAER
eukprot:274477-Pleurochrysis_carterae.AAC.9